MQHVLRRESRNQISVSDAKWAVCWLRTGRQHAIGRSTIYAPSRHKPGKLIDDIAGVFPTHGPTQHTYYNASKRECEMSAYRFPIRHLQV